MEYETTNISDLPMNPQTSMDNLPSISTQMPNNEIEASNNLDKENINIKSNEKISLLEEYIDMEYIRSIKMPTKDYLIDIFDNNLLLVLVLTAIVVFFLLN